MYIENTVVDCFILFPVSDLKFSTDRLVNFVSFLDISSIPSTISFLLVSKLPSYPHSSSILRRYKREQERHAHTHTYTRVRGYT